ncbi:MAG: hypothetical protein ACYCZF_16745 [Anaerolineae bacterium]
MSEPSRGHSTNAERHSRGTRHVIRETHSVIRGMRSVIPAKAGIQYYVETFSRAQCECGAPLARDAACHS